MKSRRKSTAFDGFFGRKRHTRYKCLKIVPEIDGCTFGRLIIELCGDENDQLTLDEAGKATLAFLEAANSFIHDALGDGADLKNTAFIIRQPGKEFFIQAGNGDWEYDFCKDEDGEIYGRCVRKPLRRYIIDKVKRIAAHLGPVAITTVGILLTKPILLALLG